MDIYTCKKTKAKTYPRSFPAPSSLPLPTCKTLQDVDKRNSINRTSFHPKSVLKQPSTEVSDATGLLDIKEVHLSFQRHSPVSSIEFRGWSLVGCCSGNGQHDYLPAIVHRYPTYPSLLPNHFVGIYANFGGAIYHLFCLIASHLLRFAEMKSYPHSANDSLFESLVSTHLVKGIIFLRPSVLWPIGWVRMYNESSSMHNTHVFEFFLVLAFACWASYVNSL